MEYLQIEKQHNHNCEITLICVENELKWSGHVD